MKIQNGFTLLELLVVVLIIGILAGIALPQYRLIIAKSKFAGLKSAVKTVALAQERYYLLNNHYTTDMDALDVNISYESSTCSTSQCYYRLDKEQTKTIVLNFGGGQTYGYMRGKGYAISFVYNHLRKTWWCVPYTEGISYELCKNDGTRYEDEKFLY